MITEPFKTCPKCSKSWDTLNDFLTDSSIYLNGYQVNLKSLETGMLLFTHIVEECKTTMSIYVKNFSSMYSGARYAENKALSPECPRYCIEEKRLDRCDAHCECAFVREIIDIISNMPKG